MHAAAGGHREDGELDRGERGELSPARGGGQIARPRETFWERVAQIPAEERPQQMPGESRSRRILEPEVVESLRIARASVEPMVKQVLARKAREVDARNAAEKRADAMVDRPSREQAAMDAIVHHDGDAVREEPDQRCEQPRRRGREVV